MGDYTKLIVSCAVKVPDEEELKAKIEALGLYTSAYHSQELVVSVDKSDWHHRRECLMLVLVGQTKWGRGQVEFLDWLRPYVIQGSGQDDIWAFQISEYEDGLTVHTLRHTPKEGINYGT
jgi:hypothetical protein